MLLRRLASVEIIHRELIWWYDEINSYTCCGEKTQNGRTECFIHTMPRDTHKTSVQDILDIYFHGALTEFMDEKCIFCGTPRAKFLATRENFPAVLPPILIINLSDVYDVRGNKLLDAYNIKLSSSVVAFGTSFHLVSVVYHIGICIY